MGVEGGLCPLRIVRPSGAIKIIYIKFILSQPLRRTVVGRGLVSLSPPFLYEGRRKSLDELQKEVNQFLEKWHRKPHKVVEKDWDRGDDLEL